MKIVLWMAVMGMALGAAPARAHGQTAQERIDAAERAARSAGIPVSLLESKVAEGRAKGVPAERIATVVEQRLATLVRARDAMRGALGGTAPGAGDLSVGADALEAGVPAALLAQLTAEAPADRRAVAIAVLTQLVSEGETPARALTRVRAALRRGPEALRRLPGEVAAERDRRRAIPTIGADVDPQEKN